jgi:hypothetical protein
MKRRAVILVTAFLMTLGLRVPAQTPPVGLDELRTVLKEDERFTQLMMETWVLRDLLALKMGDNISAEATEFQTLENKLREQRASILEKLAAEQPNVQFPQKVMASADRFAASLEQFGVKRESELGKRLVAASMVFEQALNVASLGSLCNLHPFRAVCSE